MSTENRSINQLTEISEKLDVILGLLAVRGIEGDSSAMVERLRALGLHAKTIARVTGLSENAVAIRFTRMKKKNQTKTTQRA